MFGHQAAECSKKGTGKGKKGKGNGWQPPATTTRACSGCGSTSHFLRDCPSTNSQHVREAAVDEELEVLFIRHTDAITCEDDSHEHEWQKVGTRRERKVRCEPPLGLAGWGLELAHRQKNSSFRTLVAERDDNEEGWADLGIGDSAVGSAADESFWPKGQGDASLTNPSKNIVFSWTANGGDMNHYGEKDNTSKSGSDLIGLMFRVTDVRKPLLAGRRLVEKSNIVQCGPELETNFIMNVESGKKIMMKSKGGSFVFLPSRPGQRG